ncbi:MAG: zinc-dependent metalloprotease [Microbacteriaceae bacterium]|nr:zinc-dependent metalloprotease [Microbacteriaceae bacterium]
MTGEHRDENDDAELERMLRAFGITPEQLRAMGIDPEQLRKMADDFRGGSPFDAGILGAGKDGEQGETAERDKTEQNFGGLPFDPAKLQEMLGGALNGVISFGPDGVKATGFGPAGFAAEGDGAQSEKSQIDWKAAREAALAAVKAAPQADTELAEQIGRASEQALTLASLWLDEATTMGPSADPLRTLSRVAWVQETIDTWIEIASPVAESMADASSDALQEQLPEELRDMLGGITAAISKIGGALFANHLGTAIGQLSCEIFSGGDVGIPLFSGPGKGGGALLPVNIAKFAGELDQKVSDVVLYLTVRELAHARLFKHAKWLRAHLIGAICDYSRGVEISVSHLDGLDGDIDMQDAEKLQEMLRDGSLIPPKTELQEQANARLENLLALIEGWVDVVTGIATKNMPAAGALAEMIRRRRATGGPAERVFGTLVGLELRPRKLREAAALFALVEEAGGQAARDSLWEHPDLLPTLEEVERPALLLERLGLAGQRENELEDDIDKGLARLLAGEFDSVDDSAADADGGDAGEPGDEPESKDEK